MKRIENLDADIEFIDGTKTGTQLKFVLANSIARASHVEAAIAMGVALRIKDSNGSVDMDDHEFKVVFECVGSDRMTANFAKVAVLEALSSAVEVE